MKHLFCACMLIFSIFTASALELKPAQRTRFESSKKIHVLLESDASEVLLEVKGPYYVFNPHDGSKIASGLLGKRFIVRALANGLKWGEEFPGVYQLSIKPRSEETSIFINGIQYSGAVSIYAVGGTIHVVNEVNIENYVKSILSSEFATPLESEVMSSLAILVRTDAYFRVFNNRDSFWHVQAADVGYQGSALNVAQSVIAKAVDKTHHLVLVHPEAGQHQPFPTTWTEHSAGKTAAYEAIFRNHSFAPEKGVEAPHAALNRDGSQWKYQLTKRSFATAFDVSQIQSIETFVDHSSNKVYAVRIHDGEESHDFDFFTFQKILGKQHILSSDFSVMMKEDKIVFSGHGKGHGVGLCLYSASALAQNGDNALGILSKFFPETYLYNVNALPESHE